MLMPAVVLMLSVSLLQAEVRQAPAANRRRAQRAADSAHNDAVLSAAGTDDQIARSLAHEEAQLQVVRSARHFDKAAVTSPALQL